MSPSCNYCAQPDHVFDQCPYTEQQAQQAEEPGWTTVKNVKAEKRAQAQQRHQPQAQYLMPLPAAMPLLSMPFQTPLPNGGMFQISPQQFQQMQAQYPGGVIPQPGGGQSYYYFAPAQADDVTCVRCHSQTHMTEECRSKVCENADCPRPIGHTTETCYKCSRCGRRGHLAETCRVPVCTNPDCLKPGHTIENCYKLTGTPERCENCGRLGHVTAECQTPREWLTCQYCKKPGHIKTTCRRLAAKLRNEKSPCLECKDESHCYNQCPYIRNIRQQRQQREHGQDSLNAFTAAPDPTNFPPLLSKTAFVIPDATPASTSSSSYASVVVSVTSLESVD